MHQDSSSCTENNHLSILHWRTDVHHRKTAVRWKWPGSEDVCCLRPVSWNRSLHPNDPLLQFFCVFTSAPARFHLSCCVCLLAYTMGHQHGGCGHQVAPLRTTQSLKACSKNSATRDLNLKFNFILLLLFCHQTCIYIIWKSQYIRL